MYAIMVKDGDNIGLVSEPFRNLQEVYKFIDLHNLAHEYEAVCILAPYSYVSNLEVDDDEILLTEIV